MSMSKCDSFAELGIQRRKVKSWYEELQAKLQEARTSSVLKLQTPDRTQLLKLTFALGAYNDRIGQDSPFHTLSEDILRMIVNNILPRKYIEKDGVIKAGVIGIDKFEYFSNEYLSPRMIDILTRHEKVISFIEQNQGNILEIENSNSREELKKLNVQFRNILQQLGVTLNEIYSSEIM